MDITEIDFFEDLTISGETCPPDNAILPDGKKDFFRIVKSNPVTSECFISHRSRFPEKEFPDECKARAISLSDSIESLINGFFKAPAGKKKKEKLVGVVTLKESDGLILQTGAPGHHSWWRSKGFDLDSVIIQNLEI